MSCRKRWLVAVVIGIVTLSSTVGATDQPTYVRRLIPPVRGDSFRQPRSVVADLHANEIFVCDTQNHRIAIFDKDGLFQHELLGGGVFRAPIDLAVDPEGYLLVLGVHEGVKGLIALDFDGLLLGPIPLQGLPEGLDPPDLLSVALTPDGTRIFAVDKANHWLWIADRDGQILGGVDFTEGLTEDEIRDQIFAHVDAYQDTVLVAVPSDGLIHLFDHSGNRKGSVGFKGTATCMTAFPVAAALDADGTVVILDKQRAMFMRWNPKGNRCLGEHFGFGNAPGAFYQPDDLALDALGQAFVSQGFEGRIQMYDGMVPAARVDAGPEPSDSTEP